MSIAARILIEQHLPAVSWYNTAFYGLSLALVVQARGNVAKIWPAGCERWGWPHRTPAHQTLSKSVWRDYRKSHVAHPCLQRDFLESEARHPRDDWYGLIKADLRVGIRCR